MYYSQLTDLGIKLRRRSGNEKTTCPKCSESRKNKKDPCLSVNVTEGAFNCHNCFSAETEVITLNGVFKISELLGKKVFVLDANGEWVETVFKSYGFDKLYEISLRRDGAKKKIFATANHRWFARGKKKELITTQLLSGQRLNSSFPKKEVYKSLDNNGVMNGFVYGDGSLESSKRYSRAYFMGDKDSALLPFFPKDKKVLSYENGQKKIICGLSKSLKSIPRIEENDKKFIYSFLAGYFAADGDICDNGIPCINSSKLNDLKKIQELFTYVGIGTLTIKEYERVGYGKLRKIYRLPILSSFLTDLFFINKKHKERFLLLNKKYERKRWIVESVSETNRYEEVFCCEVSTTQSFTLSGNILTGNCGWKGNVRAFERKEKQKQYQRPDQNMLKRIELNEALVKHAAARGISKATLERFMVHAREEWMPQTQKKERCIAFPYVREGELVNVKYRDAKKNFRMVKDAELIFFGMQTLKDRHCAIIVEGEWDALAAYEAGFGQDYPPEANEDGEVVEHDLGRWAVLSVPNGASKGSQKLEYLDNCADWLVGIDEFVIAVDNDEAGVSLKDELVRRLGAEKCRIVEYPKDASVKAPDGSKRPPKDLNEVLVHFGVDAVKTAVNGSQSIPVDGIYYLEDVFESMLANFHKGIQLAPTTRFGEFDEFFRWKKGEINLWSGYANWGKTFFVLQLMLTKSVYDGWKWAVFSPENYPANDFYDDLVEMYVGKWLDKMTEKEYWEACDFINKHIFYVYPENDHDLESVHEKFRHLILKKGVDGVLIDPFNQLDKTQKPYERDDQYLSLVLKDIKRFALLNGVSYNIIAHPKNPSYKDGKELPVVDMYDLHGGAMWGNKSDNIIIYHRPNFHENPSDPMVDIHVRKVKRKRTGGKHGNLRIKLNWNTKRYENEWSTETYLDPQKAQSVKFKEQSGLLDNPEPASLPF